MEWLHMGPTWVAACLFVVLGGLAAMNVMLRRHLRDLDDQQARFEQERAQFWADVARGRGLSADNS